MNQAVARAGGQERANPGMLAFLVVILLLQFFPIPRLPGIPVAPENFVFALCLLTQWSRLTGMVRQGGRAATVVIALVTFGFLDWIHDFFQADLVGNPGRHLRAGIILLLMAHACAYPATRLRVLKFVIVLGVVQVIFGSLVYFVGEPFITIRNWMQQSSAQFMDQMIGEGSQIASTYGEPHIFAYLLGGFPMLALGLYFQERRWRWLLVMAVFLFGLILNAERAAAGLLLVAILVACWKSGQRVRNLTVVALLGLVFIGLQQVLVATREEGPAGVVGAAFSTQGTLSERFGSSTLEEVGARLMYQVNGIVSVIKHPVLGPTPVEYAQEVLGGGQSVLSGAIASQVLASHNHYVNAGVRAGVLGWVLMGVALVAIWRMGATVRAATARAPGVVRLPALCAMLGLGVAMGNSVFHNAGIFSAELATIIMIGLLSGLYRQALGDAARSARARAAPPPAPVEPQAGDDPADDEEFA